MTSLCFLGPNVVKKYSEYSFLYIVSGFFFQHDRRIKLPPQDDDLLLRVDFVREVDELLKEVQAEQDKKKQQIGFDPESVAYMLKQQEKMQTIRQVESLLDLASSLKW